MNYTAAELLLLPIGLGLLGFVEPCTIGGHLLFLNTQINRSRTEQLRAVVAFVAGRSFVAGLFGALVAFLGQILIEAQTGFWLAFGALYLAIGLILVTGKSGYIRTKIDIAPNVWKHAKNPVVLGLGFGLNIPACAAPILFGVLGLAATSGTFATGFLMMFVFGLSLSLPLVLCVALPGLVSRLGALGNRGARFGWLTGSVFVLLGLWSIWFGLYVNPADWVPK